MTYSVVNYSKWKDFKYIKYTQPLLVIIRPQLTMIIMSMTVLRNELSCYIIKSVIMFYSMNCVYTSLRWGHITCYK